MKSMLGKIDLRRWVGLAVLLVVLATGCAQAVGAGQSEPALSFDGQVSTIVAETLAAVTVEPTAAPSATASPEPTATATLTPTPTQTEPPPTPTPTLHPMMIEALRQGSYPGSAIEIHEVIAPSEFAPDGNYTRYYASYLSEGYRIYGLLTIPPGEMPPGGWPAIVFNHGYIRPDMYRTTERYVGYVNGLANSGYIVFRIDYRGHGRSEGRASGAYGSTGYTADVLNAVAALKQYPLVNPEKIGMWGHSMGGYLTLRAMVVSPDIKAGVIWAGVVGSYPDMLTRWRRGAGPTPTPPPLASGWRDDWLATFGTPEENPAFWSAISANSYLAYLSGPVQLHHGTADATVPAHFSETLYNELQAAGQYAELHLYPGDDHNIGASFNTAMARTVAFFDRYLKP
jgi:uncharacterized protein